MRTRLDVVCVRGHEIARSRDFGICANFLFHQSIESHENIPSARFELLRMAHKRALSSATPIDVTSMQCPTARARPRIIIWSFHVVEAQRLPTPAAGYEVVKLGTIHGNVAMGEGGGAMRSVVPGPFLAGDESRVCALEII